MSSEESDRGRSDVNEEDKSENESEKSGSDEKSGKSEKSKKSVNSEKNSDDNSDKSEKENESDASEEANKSEKSEDESEKSEKANKNNKSNKNSKKEIVKPKPIFDLTKLVLSNEVKIDLVTIKEEKKEIINEESNKIFDFSLSNPIIRHKTSINILSEVNNNLDELFEDLSRTMKSFREDSKLKSVIKESRSPKKAINYNSSSGEDEKSRGKREKQTQSQRKFYTDKETNTKEVGMRTSGNHPGTNHGNHPGNQNILRNSNSKYTPTNPYNYKITPNLNQNNNHMRTVEDLYRQNKAQPIIYNNERNYMRNPIPTKKNYEGEPYDSDYIKSKQRYQQMLEEKNKYKPKNINQAIDILLDKDF